MPTWLIWVIVVVVVLVIAALVIAMAGKRRTEQRRGRAEELRQEASAHASGLSESQRQADELRAKADLAKTEAERLEERAATAEQGHQVEQAGYEDKLREADRLDPEVDHKAADYSPDVWNDESSDTAPPAGGAVTGPRHAQTSTTGASEAPTTETSATGTSATGTPTTGTPTAADGETTRGER
jgi:hypothetical protein